jgi:hypothetical protein
MSAWRGYIQAVIYFPEKNIEQVYKLAISEEQKKRSDKQSTLENQGRVFSRYLVKTSQKSFLRLCNVRLSLSSEIAIP